MKCIGTIALGIILFLTGCSTTKYLDRADRYRSKNLESLGNSSMHFPSAEECHAKLIEAFHASHFTEVVKLANKMQRWGNSPHRASSDHLAGYAILFIAQPDMWNATSSPENWETYVDVLQLAEQAFERSCKNASSGTWKKRNNRPLGLISGGFSTPDVLASYLYAKHISRVMHYQKYNGNLDALHLAIREYEELLKDYPKWAEGFPFIAHELKEIKTSVAIWNGRKAEADLKFGRRQ